MVTSCHGNGFHITGPLWGESTGIQGEYHRILTTKGMHVMRSFNVSFVVDVSMLLNKQSICRWPQTLWPRMTSLYDFKLGLSCTTRPKKYSLVSCQSCVVLWSGYGFFAHIPPWLLVPFPIPSETDLEKYGQIIHINIEDWKHNGN